MLNIAPLWKKFCFRVYKAPIIRKLLKGTVKVFFGNVKLTLPVLSGCIQGSRLLVMPGHEENAYWLGSWEQPIQDIIQKLVQDCRDYTCIYDIGAHIGFFSIAFARKFPTATVMCFEPNIDNAQRLQTNLRMNKLLNRVTLCPFGVYGRTGAVGFSQGTSFTRAIQPESEPVGEQEYIFALSLDDAVFSFGMLAPSFIKIDAEGSEAAILQGAIKTLETSRPNLLIEVHDQDNAISINRILQSYTTRIVCLETEGEVEKIDFVPPGLHYFITFT